LAGYADRIMHFEGKTWMPPPRVEEESEETDEEKQVRVAREEGWVEY
jgi:hypothetical protein